MTSSMFNRVTGGDAPGPVAVALLFGLAALLVGSILRRRRQRGATGADAALMRRAGLSRQAQRTVRQLAAEVGVPPAALLVTPGTIDRLVRQRALAGAMTSMVGPADDPSPS